MKIKDHSSNKFHKLIHVLLMNSNIPTNKENSELENRIVNDIIKNLPTMTVSILNMRKVQKYLKLRKNQTKSELIELIKIQKKLRRSLLKSGKTQLRNMKKKL